MSFSSTKCADIGRLRFGAGINISFVFPEFLSLKRIPGRNVVNTTKVHVEWIILEAGESSPGEIGSAAMPLN